MQKRVRISHLIKPLYFLMFAILLELVNFLWLDFYVTGNKDLRQVLPSYIVIDISFLMFFAGIIFICKRKISNVVFYVILGLQLAVNMINATLYKVFGDIFSFDMMKLGAEAVSAFKFEFIDFWSILANIGILAIVITTQVLLDKYFKKEINLKTINKKALLIISFFSCWVIALSSFFIQKANFYHTDTAVAVSESDEYLWDNMHFKLEAYKKFGTWGFYTKSISNLIYKNDYYDKNKEEDLLNNLKNGEQKLDVTAPLYGDNLIVIMLESFEWFAIDPFNTPTLWNIRTESGISFENFYGKNKTNVSEAISILGNMPKDVSMNKLAKNKTLNSQYSLPNLFKDLGYTSNFFHSYKKSFYDRSTINKQMGFDKVYGIEDADIKNKSTKFNDWNLEVDFIKSMIEEMAPTDTPFMSFYTTVSSHGTYNKTNERFKDYYSEYDSNLVKYKSWLERETTYIYPEDNDLEKAYRQYKCAAMDTDKMVEYLLTYLEDNNLKDNTTIVMYADHNCYYQDLYFNIKGTSKADYYDIYNYNIPFMIYSEKLLPEVNTTFCNTYDIYPTICELFGLPYNKFVSQGYNVFSPEIENSVMVSYLSGAFNKGFYTLNIVDMFTAPDVTQEDLLRFKRNACKFYEKQKDIELMYKYGLLVK